MPLISDLFSLAVDIGRLSSTFPVSLCQGVVSGILLVTSNKIFFDPCKTHPLVKEHGCEEYLLSCSVDNLASVSFFTDISHVHFTKSQQRSARIHFLLSNTQITDYIKSPCK